MSREVLIFREADVRAALDMPSLIDAVERAFVAYSTGRAELPGVIHLDVPEAGGEIHVKAGHILEEPFYAVKVSSGFYAPNRPPDRRRRAASQPGTSHLGPSPRSP